MKTIRTKQRNRFTVEEGFTLIELIIVVAIIGIVVAFVGINISQDSDRLAKQEAKRFHAVVNEVRDEAILTGANYLLTVNHKSNDYEFEKLGSKGKSGSDNSAGDLLLARRSLEAGVTVEWDVFDDVDEGDDIQPQVLITPLGEITAFDAHFSGSDYDYHVFVNDEYQLEQRIEKGSIF